MCEFVQNLFEFAANNSILSACHTEYRVFFRLSLSLLLPKYVSAICAFPASGKKRIGFLFQDAIQYRADKSVFFPLCQPLLLHRKLNANAILNVWFVIRWIVFICVWVNVSVSVREYRHFSSSFFAYVRILEAKWKVRKTDSLKIDSFLLWVRLSQRERERWRGQRIGILCVNRQILRQNLIIAFRDDCCQRDSMLLFGCSHFLIIINIIIIL